MAMNSDEKQERLPLKAPTLLTEAHDSQQFDCGNEALNNWFQKKALKNQRIYGQTYVVCRGTEVVGFYTIAPGAIERTSVKGRFRRNAPDSIPIIKLCRLAVSLTEQGTGLGTDLLSDVVRTAKQAQTIQGGRAVLVDAKDEAAKQFYEKNGFESSKIDPLVLLYDLK